MTNEQTPGADVASLKGFVTVDLWRPTDAGTLELVEHEEIENLVTQVGDQYYGERAAGLGSLGIATCMKLGTGTTAASKTGAGAGIVTYLSGSNSAFSPAVASSLNGSSRRITYATTWAAGTATNSAITEAVIAITNANSTSVAADCIARVVFTAKDKQALDTLTITWHHDLLGA
jgi:hypothetical protein